MAANIDANLANWSVTDASNQPEGTDSADIDADLRRLQATIRKYTRTIGTNMASAATLNLATADGDVVNVTGTTAITALGTVSAGMRFWLVFADALTFTHGAGLLLPGAANITTAAGDVACMESLGSGNWRCLSYMRANGAPVDPELAAIAGLTSAANKIPMFSGSGTATLIDFKDEDDMASDSATAVPSQQSVKAFAAIASQVAPGASGNLLTSDGSAWVSATPDVSLAANGYAKLRGGLIVQWGTKALSSVTQAIDFTAEGLIDFPTACLAVFAVGGHSSGQYYAIGAHTLLTTGFTAYSNSGALTIRWLAIGH